MENKGRYMGNAWAMHGLRNDVATRAKAFVLQRCNKCINLIQYSDTCFGVFV